MNVYIGFIVALVAVQFITVGAAPASILKFTKNHYDLTSASSSSSSSSSSQQSSQSLSSSSSILLSTLSPPVQPHRQHPYRHHRHSRHIKISDFESPQWMNPCEHDVSATEYISLIENVPHNTLRNRKIALEQMMAILPSLVDDVDLMHAIDTSHISDWFGHNSSYSFLRRVNVSQNKIPLKTWHRNVQVYVGAFQNLWLKQVKAESSHSSIAQELYNLTVKSKKLLCEIEVTINSTDPVIGVIFTAEQMKEILKFRNNDTNAVDDIDTKFTKVRFFEYLKNVRSQTRERIIGIKSQIRKLLRHKNGVNGGRGGGGKGGIAKKVGNRKRTNSKNKNKNKNEKPIDSLHKKRNKNNDRHNKKRVHHKNNNNNNNKKNKQNTKLNHKNEILSISPQ